MPRRASPSAPNGAALRLVCVSILLLAPLAAAPPGAAPPEAAFPALREGRHGASSLRIVSGVPVLTLRGTPAEMGRAQGTLLGEEIRFLKENYLARWLGRFGAHEAFLQAAKGFEGTLAPAEREELSTLAEAASVPLDDALLVHAFLDMTQPFLCTGVAVGPERAGEGGPFLARNLDFPSLGVSERYSIVCVRRPARGKATITVGWPGMIGVLSGMNEDGLALATLVAYGFRGERGPGPPYVLLLKRILEGCATADEAAAALAKAQRTTANSLLVLDARGDAACLEYTPKSIERRGYDGGLLFAVNDFQKLAPPAGLQASDSRIGSLGAWRAEAASGRARLAPLDLRAPLRQCQMGDLTLQSMVLRPSDRRLWVSLGRTRAADGEFVELDGKALLADPEPER